ncbi:DUF6919 domain-containing protein [Streptomyces sp. Amel2xB2]|uniref:DUF6919 domain-containing protein n=1 Tax=Streptomyces sp. Amel2xB2 TaxID=1305829 RepID=UPI0011B93548|nr:hypothetical protein [Streptomyces sp. Amel2xB2]
MSRRDRRLWQSASTVPDLGELMARWLEGDLKSWPGYAPGYGPDDETRHLVPTLAALNRAGVLTHGSQPGHMGAGFDGAWWSQRAAVSGFVADPSLFRELLFAAADNALLTLVTGGQEAYWPEPIPVTTRNSETVTDFGMHLGRRDLRCMWPTINDEAFTAIEAAWQVTMVAPGFGALGERMWPVLATAVEEAVDVAA